MIPSLIISEAILSKETSFMHQIQHTYLRQLSFITLTLVLSVFFSILIPVQGFAERDLEVHFIDIGQGDAALIVSPAGKTVLIDSGPSKSWSALSGYLDGLGIKTIDMMINSHPHADHIGNAAKVIERYQVKVVLDSGFAHPIKAYRDLLDAVETHKVSLRLARKGRTIEIGGGAKLQLLAPEEPFIRHSRSDPNSNSIVFRLTYKEQAALFTGDAEEETERRLLVDPSTLRADLLKVAHHGSKHASGHAFLSAVNPQVAIISCSEANRYGHPSPETLDSLRRAQATPLVTAQAGHILAKTDGNTWTVKPVHAENAVTTSTQRDQPASQEAAKRVDPQPAHPIAVEPPQSTASELININTASVSELQKLPRIGEKLAQRIIEARAQDPFTSAEDLRRVNGIGQKTVEQLVPLITF